MMCPSSFHSFQPKSLIFDILVSSLLLVLVYPEPHIFNACLELRQHYDLGKKKETLFLI